MKAVINNLRFNTLRNALYHTARRRFFELWNRIFNFAIVVLGAAATSDVLGVYGIGQTWIGLAVAFIAAGQLVFDFGRAARDHQSLQRDYYHVLAEIEETPSPNKAACAAWQAKLIRIAADEPPVLRAIDAKAYNDAMDALELYPKQEKVRIPLHHKLFGWFWAFDGYSYQKLNEIDDISLFRRFTRWRKSRRKPAAI